MKIKLYFVLIAILTFNQSCKKFLGKNDLTNLTADQYFKTEADVKIFVDGLYNHIVKKTDYENLDLDYATDFNALNPGRGDVQYTDIALGTYSPTSVSTSYYWDYSPIRSSYVFFDKVKDVPMSDASMQLYTGSVYYVLAYRYFVMLRAYENVPIITEVLSADKADIGSSPKEEVYAEALKNVNNAIANLPSLGPNDRERGRLTKLCALALKADMTLYVASRYEGSIASASWQDAADAAQAAITEADNVGYGLSSSYENLFIASHQSEADIQKEIILEHVGLKGVTGTTSYNAYGTWVFRPRHDGYGITLYCATQELVDMYECVDGKPINKSPLYDPSHPFANRDSRLTSTILYPGNIPNTLDPTARWVSNSLDPAPANNDYMLSTFDPRDVPLSGYINIKYWDRDESPAAIFGSDYTSSIVYRYAELLLMYAEAKNEATGPDESVYTAISKVRQRSGMPAVDASTHPSQVELRSLIRNERAVEFQCEDKRYWDVRRWGVGEQVQNKPFYTMHISKFNPDGSFNSYMSQIYVRTSLTDPSQEALFSIPDGASGGRLMTTGGFSDAKYYVWPIPQNAINASSSGALKQHPLW